MGSKVLKQVVLEIGTFPYLEIDTDGEEFIDVNVSITITALRDLMVDKSIPNDVNNSHFATIEF